MSSLYGSLWTPTPAPLTAATVTQNSFPGCSVLISILCVPLSTVQLKDFCSSDSTHHTCQKQQHGKIKQAATYTIYLSIYLFFNMILGQYDIDKITIIDCNGAAVSANAKKRHQFCAQKLNLALIKTVTLITLWSVVAASQGIISIVSQWVSLL